MKAMMRFPSMTALAALTLLAGGLEAYAMPRMGVNPSVAPKRPGLHVTTRRETIAPFGFVKFCATQQSQCEKQGDSTMVDLSKAKRAELQRINAQVNQQIRYEDDSPDEDEWRAGVPSGDCDDYAVTKRQRLLDAGWPSGALRIATARTAEGIGHAVLVVSTTQGDLVLDNRTNVVKPWFATQLQWIKIQSPQDPRKWLKI